jgi:hypothetical protein
MKITRRLLDTIYADCPRKIHKLPGKMARLKEQVCFRCGGTLYIPLPHECLMPGCEEGFETEAEANIHMSKVHGVARHVGMVN